MSEIQNAHHPRDQTSAPTRILDCVHRSLGWLLAHSHCTEQKTLSGFQIQRNTLPVSVPSFWLKRRPTSLYQNHSTRRESPSRGRYLVSTIPRRPSTHCQNERRMRNHHSEGTEDNQKHGTTRQRKEVKTHSEPRFRMAWSTMESPVTYSTGSRDKVPTPPGGSEVHHNLRILYEKNSNEGTRSLQLDRPERPQHTIDHVNYKNNLEDFPKTSPRHTDPNTKEPEDATKQLDQPKIFSTTARGPSTGLDHPDGRIKQRVGFSDQPGLFQRLLRSVNDTPHQCERNACYMVRTPDGLSEKHSDSGTLRQPLSTTGTTKGRINDLSLILSSRTDMEESNKIQLATQDISHRRSAQRPRGPTQQRFPNINGMEFISQGLPKDTQIESTLTGGSIRYEVQQQAREVCVTVSGLDGDSCERTDNIMGQMGSPIHVSTDTFNFEGFEPSDQILLQERNSHHGRLSYSSVVYGTTIATSAVNPTGSKTPTDSNGRGRTPDQSFKTSRVAIIKQAYETKFQSRQRTISLLTTPIRQSSINDYQIKWGKFCTFLTEQKITPSQLSLDHVLDFFSYLFYEKGVLPNTVAHYRSALSVPLELGFKIDLRHPDVSRLLRSMRIKRPNTPVIAPVWSLNKVLAYIDNWPDRISLTSLLQKTAFLLMLATGYRISELNACVRMRDFCFISKDLKLSLRPHPTLLGKNEGPQHRWPHKSIPSLRLQDGSLSRLCPVNTLSDYLNRTSRIKSGNLLIHPSSQKALTIKQLRVLICKLIKEADPGKKGKPHDIRKYAASYLFAESMDVSEVIKALHWRSPHTFYKYYMCTTTPLTRPTSLPHIHRPRHRKGTTPDAATDQDKVVVDRGNSSSYGIDLHLGTSNDN